LRFALLEQLGGHDKIKWGHQLVDLKEVEGETVELSFEVSGEVKIAKADLVVGADGIRSSVRSCSLVTVLPLALPRLYCDIGNLSFSCSQRY
jgi:2-polyprenyl-6-methoxyphenol hydroxylase-like FAD-dependent oxidoreductase